jgi:hypothetical protein
MLSGTPFAGSKEKSSLRVPQADGTRLKAGTMRV